jgi:hypothetical protein
MTTLITSILMGLLRYLLAGVVFWMVENGIATEGQTEQLIAGIAGGVVMLGWLVWVKYKDRLSIVTALAMPEGTTVNHLKAQIKSGATAPAAGDPDVKPTLSPTS